MQCKPFYLYERGGLLKRNGIGISVQSVLTNRGRICFCVIAEAKPLFCNDNNPVGMLVHELTSWFYETAIPLYCSSKSKRKIYLSMKRKLLYLHQKIQSLSVKDSNTYRCSVQTLIIVESGYVGASAGDGGFVRCQKRKLSQNVSLCRKLHAEKLYLGEKNNIRINKIAGVCSGECYFLLFSNVFSDVLTVKHLRSLFSSAKTEEETEKGLTELKKRRMRDLKEECLGCVCVFVKQ